MQSLTLNEGLRVCDVISSDVISIPLRRDVIEHNCEEAKFSTFSLKKPLKYLNSKSDGTFTSRRCECCKTESRKVLNENSSRACRVLLSDHPILEQEESASRLTSAPSLDPAAPLPWPLVSLAGATLICCTGMLLFPSNAAELLPRLCQRAGPAHPLVRVPASVPPSRPPAAPPHRPHPPGESCSHVTLFPSFQTASSRSATMEWDQIAVATGLWR